MGAVIDGVHGGGAEGHSPGWKETPALRTSELGRVQLHQWRDDSDEGKQFRVKKKFRTFKQHQECVQGHFVFVPLRHAVSSHQLRYLLKE